jgi:hypothetical protein
MSDQSNTALIQSLYAAFNSGDIQTLLANVRITTRSIMVSDPPSIDIPKSNR